MAGTRLGRWWGLLPVDDELLGGLVIWIAASMLVLLAVLLLVRLWGRSEERLDQRRRQGFAMPLNDRGRAAPAADAAAARRRVGWGLALVPIMVLAGVMALALWLTWHPGKPPLPVPPLERIGVAAPAGVSLGERT
jgi:hypothetical protein